MNPKVVNELEDCPEVCPHCDVRCHFAYGYETGVLIYLSCRNSDLCDWWKGRK